jgi:hypothetical protein
LVRRRPSQEQRRHYPLDGLESALMGHLRVEIARRLPGTGRRLTTEGFGLRARHRAGEQSRYANGEEEGFRVQESVAAITFSLISSSMSPVCWLLSNNPNPAGNWTVVPGGRTYSRALDEEIVASAA